MPPHKSSHEVASREQALDLAQRLERVLTADASLPAAHPRLRLAKALARALIDEITLAGGNGADIDGAGVDGAGMDGAA